MKQFIRSSTQGYQRHKLVSTIKMFYGIHHDLVDPYNVAVFRLFLMFLPQTSHAQTFKIPDIRFSRPFPIFLGSGHRHGGRSMLTKIMLTFHGRLTTPFHLGSMSVRLNILMCHFVYRFMSLPGRPLGHAVNSTVSKSVDLSLLCMSFFRVTCMRAK